MTIDPKNFRITYTYPFYEDYVAPKGFLTLDKASHACFHYAMLATRARALAGSGPESQIIEYKVGETPPEWMESRDKELAISVAIQYALESPEKFLVFKKEAWAQARQLGITVPDEVWLVSPADRHKIH